MVRKTNKKVKIQHRVSINQRPKYIERRKELGHFEGDLFFNAGSMSANVLNLVDRKSRMTILIKNDSKFSEPIIDRVSRSMAHSLKVLPLIMVRNLPCIIGFQKTGIKTYFCNPGSPWQKGSVENSNGALRR